MRGNGWQVFGVIVVLFLLQFIVTPVIQAIADSVSDTFAGYAVADLIVRLLVAPLSALAAAVLYFELKALQAASRCWRGPAGTATRRPAAPGGPHRLRRGAAATARAANSGGPPTTGTGDAGPASR